MNIPPVNYMVIGSPKCATTTICKFLEQHPEVYITDPKEPRFFCPAVSKEKQSWDWYNSLFREVKSEKAIGEGTVNYTCSDYRSLADPEIIHRYYPDVKLVYMVRDPIERIESQWLMNASMGWPSDLPDFDTAVRNSSRFLNTSRYWTHLNRYRRFFSDSQFHIIFFEDFKKAPQATMRQLFEFLEVDPQYTIESPNERYNVSDKAYIDGGVSRFLRRTKLVELARQLIPRPIYKNFISLVKVKNPGHPTWNEDTLAWVINELRDDSLRFLDYCHKPHDFWNCYNNRPQSNYESRFLRTRE